MNFRNRLVLFLVVTLVAVQVFTGIFVYNVIRDRAIEQGKSELKAATEIFVRQLDALSGRVSDAVEVLALDYPLRSAIAAQDHETILSVLHNHGRRVGAARMMLVGLDGTITADTQDAQAKSARFAFSGLLEKAAQDERGQGVAAFDGKIYWLVAVPVRAPVPIAFIVAFLPVDDALAQNLRELSALPIGVSFLRSDMDGAWKITAQDHALPVQLPRQGAFIGESAKVVQSKAGEYLTLSESLPTVPQSAPVVVVLDYPLADALRQFRAIVRPMAIVLSLGLVIALGGAFLIAGGISRPLESLAATTRRIEAGDYAPPPPLRASGEIAQLARALGSMAQAISYRESDLATAMTALEISRDDAVRANRAKSEFLANMSHELRTPLNAVMGFSEMMQAEALGPLGSQRYVDYAGHIHESGSHLLELVTDMLDLARVEAGKLVIARSRIRPSEILEASLTMLRPQAEAAGVALIADADLSAIIIEGDALRLKQVLVNIIGNAIKFTPRGGSVRIAGEISVAELRVRVTDTGIGMRPEDIPLVVKPFHRLSPAFDAKYQGAGLGLPIAKAAVELHGGRLDIDSALGAGTTVTIVLPTSSAQPAGKAA